MKKIFTLISALGFTAAMAQAPLVNQSSLITHPGGGPGGADVSATQTSTLGMTLFGSNMNYSTTALYWMGEKITVPSGSSWSLDSLITYGYQTGSSTVSTFTALYAYVSADSSNTPSHLPVAGNKTSNILIGAKWSNIYRNPDDVNLTSTQRPIMQLKGNLTGIIPAGTYWICWSTGGTLASGPWCPPVTIKNNPITGNAKQKTPSGWTAVVDGTVTPTRTQGMPFKLYGSVISGVNEVENSVNNVTIHPSPMTSNATVNITLGDKSSLSDLSFVMYDITGKEVLRNTNITNSTFTIERGDLSAGTYMYKVSSKSSGNALKSGKIIVQ